MFVLHRVLGCVLLLSVGGCYPTVSDGAATESTKPAAVEKMVDNEDELIEKVGSEGDEKDSTKEQAFLREGLRTNTAKTSIPLNDVLNGGPGKDGIPAINEPVFVSATDDELEYLSEGDLGVLVEIGGDAKFYPYAILNRHEIVNDVVGGEKISVTFCPLCGSALVFDRILESGEEVNFGVSGRLWNSNLLMYDTATESLWSQAFAEAMVGDALGEKLTIVDSDVVSIADFRRAYPDGQVLSTETGFSREYNRTPYSGYGVSDELYFPVENDSDARLQVKELLYAANDGDVSVAFHRANILTAGSATLTVEDKIYTATVDNGQITIIRDGKEIAGYTEMWFSRANKNPNSKYLRTGE